MFQNTGCLFCQAESVAAKVDPCALLTDAEARQHFPKAKAAERERTREKYGITACLWDHPAGRLVLQLTLGAKPGSSTEEAQGLALGFVDPLKRRAGQEIRYEKIDGEGGEAVAVVEKADKARGILSDAAYLYTQRGDVPLLVAVKSIWESVPVPASSSVARTDPPLLSRRT